MRCWNRSSVFTVESGIAAFHPDARDWVERAGDRREMSTDPRHLDLRSNAFLGLATSLASAGLAVALVPSNYASSGAMLQPALILTVGLLIAPAIAAYRSPASIFRVEHLIMVGLIYWVLLDLLQSA